MRSLIITISGIVAVALVIIGNIAPSKLLLFTGIIFAVVAIALTVTDSQNDRKTE